MSYESKIYIVRKHDRIDDIIGKKYAQVLMTFKLGRISNELEEFLCSQRETDCCFYADDGDTMILEDCYGEPLKEIDLYDLKEALDKELDEIFKRPNLDPRSTDSLWVLARGVLHMSLLTYGKRSNEVVCLHYGY